MLATATYRDNFYRREVEHLRNENTKLQEKLDQETENSICLYKTWHQASKVFWKLQRGDTSVSSDITVSLTMEDQYFSDHVSSDKTKFLSQAKCI